MTNRLQGDGRIAGMVETLFTILLPLFAVFFIWQAFQVPEPPRNIVVGPRTVPVLIGILMLAVSGMLAWRRFQAHSSVSGGSATGVPSKESGEEAEDVRVSDWPAVWIVLSAILAEVLLLEILGFVITLSAFLFGLSTVFAPQKWVRNLTVSLLFSVTVYSLFTTILRIPLPNGILDFAF